jgi:S-adenosyl-L-methionine methyltransferase
VSVLDELIRRLMAQRACLDQAAEWIARTPGPAILIGFGDGSAYYHLCALLPHREIVIFDRSVDAEVLLELPSERVVLGDPMTTLPLAWDRLKRSAALALLNFPVTNPPRLAGEVAPLLAPVLSPGAVIVSEKALSVPGWTGLTPPSTIGPGRFHMYEAG